MSVSISRVALVIGSLAVILLAGKSIFDLLVFCTSNFSTTVVIYLLLSAIPLLVLRKHPRFQNVALLLISALLVLFCAEVFLRFLRKDPITYSEMHGNGYVSMYRTDVGDNWYVLRKEGRKDIHTLEWAPYEVRDNKTLDYQYPDYQCNARGLRGKLPHANQKVVLTLGDSFNEGAGAPCDSTYPVLLEKQLQARDTSWAVINGGVSGNDPFFDWQMLKKLHAAFAITDVVFLINSTDINDVQMRGGMERFLPSGELNYTDGPWWEPIYAISFVSRLFFHGVMKVERNLMTSEAHVHTMTSASLQIGQLFREVVVPFCESNAIRVHIVTHPLPHEFSENSEVYERMQSVLSNISGVSQCDCRIPLQRFANGDELYWPNDRHFKPKGYALLSECVFQGFQVGRPIDSPLKP